MDEIGVKDLTRQIQGKRAERDGYKAEVKRLNDEIEELDLKREGLILSNADQTRLDLVGE
jgi:cell division protein FtsB